MPGLAIGACSSFGADGNDASTDGGPDGGSSTEGGADAGNIMAEAGPPQADSGLDCADAIVCDDFERVDIADTSHPWVATQDHGTIKIISGVLDSRIDEGTNDGPGPQAIIQQTPVKSFAPGKVMATVDLDLEILERGAANSGFTNVLSVDLDGNQANFTIYLDGGANAHFVMKTDVQENHFAASSANAGPHHIHFEGLFDTNATFSAFVDQLRVGGGPFGARQITNPSVRVEVGARDTGMRGKNHVTIDNLVVRVSPAG